MHALVLWAALSLGVEAPPDGTLLFLENCNRFVELYTGSPIGHVAVVLRDGGTAYVYEATPDRVRRMTVAEYYADLARTSHDRGREIKVWMLTPKAPYSAEQLERMRRYGDQHIQRRYSIANYFNQKEGDGCHCAEFTANVLNEGRCCERFKDPFRETPAKLLETLAAGHLPKQAIALPKYEPQETWCQSQSRIWQGRWQLCKWGALEAAIWLDGFVAAAVGY